MSLRDRWAAQTRTIVHDREVGAAPPQVRIRNRTRMNFESGIANHREIFRSCPLHIHRMTKEQANDPGTDVLAGRLGKQQHAVVLEHAVKFTKDFVLLDQMMKRLMAEHHINGLIGQGKR